MSLLTVQLLGRKPSCGVRRGKWSRQFEVIADRLVAAFGVPSLGNYDDPVQEIFYIALSARTTDAQYRKTHRALNDRFPSLAQLANADVKDVLLCIAEGGLANKRAAQLKATARKLLDQFGSEPSEAIRAMTPKEAYTFLVNLPGMGPKSALCVMMCSLDSDVFPVDVNVQRIAARLGAIKGGLKHYQAQRQLPRLIPKGRSRELHVGMVVLGRHVCLPRSPRCEDCPINDLCKTGKQALRRQKETDGRRVGNASKG